MEKSKFLYGALGLLTLGLSACSSEEPLAQEQKVTKDETRYITVAISSPNEMARSRGFENGTPEENYVSRIDFIFYDINGHPTASPKYVQYNAEGSVSSSNAAELEAGKFQDQTDGSNVAKIFTSIVPVELTQGMNLPAQVICIINGDAAAVNTLQNNDLSYLREKTQTQFTRSNNFLMTNSVYYGQNVLTGEANQRLCATPINANNQLFKTKTEAQTALDNATTDATTLVDIYVERVGAKVALTLDKSKIYSYTLENGEGTGNIVLKFVPEYWLMNATDTECYLTKRYGVDNNGVINKSPEYDEINTALGNAGWTDWNAVALHRSYWGTSPSYFADNFPLTSDQVNDLEEGSTEAKYSVNYYSYNDVKKIVDETTTGNTNSRQARGVNGDGGFDASVIYTRESTTPKKTINNDGTNGNPAASVASAVIVGHYVVGDATAGADFYVDRNSGNGGTYYASVANVLNEFMTRQSIVFADENGSNLVTATTNFTVEHPKSAVREKLANPNIAGRLVTIQLLTANNLTAWYYNPNDPTANENGYARITSTNLADVNAQLVSAGYMEYFNTGLAFFSVPIRHLNWKDTSYTKGATGEDGVTSAGTYNWTQMSVGELGVVRNHSYYLTIESISGLGNALRSPDQPIVPAKDAVNQYIAMRLNILAWNIARTWSVPL